MLRRTTCTRVTAWLLMLLCLLPMRVMAGAAVPALDDPVVDAANALSADTRDILRTQAFKLQARTGAQLQVLVVDHAGDEGIEAYAQRAFDQWQLGREGVDDGVLLLVAVQDRRVRIQTGYGLEGAIPDAYAARIIDKAIVPRFRDGDLDQGLLDGTKVVVALIDGEDLPAWEAPSMRNVLPADWRSADSVVAMTLLAGFLAGLWRSPPSAPAARMPDDLARRHRERQRGAPREVTTPQARPKRLPAWGRPLLVTAVVAAGLLSAAMWAPRQALAAVCLVLALCVPVASLLGWCWRRSRGVRVVLLGMLGVSSGFLVVMMLRGQLPPSLALHTLLDLAAGIVAMLLFFLVQACRARWHKDRSSFGVRFAVLLLLTAGYVLFALLAIDRADPVARLAATIGWGAGTVVLYFAWIFTMLPGEKARGSRRSSVGHRSASSSPSSSSSASSSSSWSGGGGRSGGGGASGSW
ncbi:TPM domain-containing protein [Stenotrophomonas maltophilia]|uniref:TPM domain-containing protein n=1 Tax=unclassified Stenotrophomonas TaxID=196198 RepID=UPI0018D40340|nr:TPM domain-containing protein [Stenotrophomonas sp. 9]MBH1736686.1 TPM domain-containing protein [Stenotrophomonas maltophilia]WNB82167.1 TPM domain-containing protein [Stenotrophomonas sp. 9]